MADAACTPVAQGFGVPDYYAVANDHTLLVILIEDVIAVQNLDEILNVDHIDVFFVAPADLASSMGHIDDEGHPEVQNTINDALAQIIGRGSRRRGDGHQRHGGGVRVGRRSVLFDRSRPVDCSRRKRLCRARQNLKTTANRRQGR